VGRGVPLSTGDRSGAGAVPSLQRNFLELQVKNAGFMHFYSEKLLVARKWD